MKPPLTPEEERAYVRQLIAGYEEVNAFVAAERRARTEAQRWDDSDALHLSRLDGWPTPRRREQACGLIEQQRWFRKLAGR